jgi:lipopolysaccharide export system protein LptC
LPLGIAAVLAAVTYWLGNVANLPIIVDMAGFGHDPEYIVEDFRATAYDLQGRPRYRLSAERMTHYLDDETSALEHPRFVREIPELPVLRATAKRGVLSGDGENVYLLDNVRLERDNGPKRPPLLMETQYLRIVPAVGLMRTDKPVVITKGKSVVTAGAMEDRKSVV